MVISIKKWVLFKFPFLYKVRVAQLQTRRRFQDVLARCLFARRKSAIELPYRCAKHKSVLRRTLQGSDPQLQENKITNLRIALGHIDGIIIRPGETFSFWRLVGKPTARKGYIDGLMLAYGEVRKGVGGGLCQLANLLFWLALHTPLQIKERHHHSFDLFPDDRRTVPFGSGTSIFYNYLDLRFFNPTDYTFQLKLWLTDTHLEGTVRCDSLLPLLYRIEERNHRFYEWNGLWYRENEIWRLELDAASGDILTETMLLHNRAEVKYVVRQEKMGHKSVGRYGEEK
ncbi:vancomycin resistance protein VanW [Paenibacillus tianmuensis]|uniref:Vancomycin resistance protein VanW n=1 Tax=Paenibacillus tianmuensis TaxID=624147 RepID=A0A1G4T9U9_9BACL|nr:VanW family protein [Paenibacillus tianmuensis]SCW78121.1 vancomycin resistance protein VanW [Paenibacillus tianmuensis]